MEHNESIQLESIYDKRRLKVYTDSVFTATPKKIFYVFGNKNALLNIGIITISFCALIRAPFLYAVLLLDVFKVSPDLVNIWKSISTNKVQLLYTLVLSIIVVYIFAMWGFM